MINAKKLGLKEPLPLWAPAGGLQDDGGDSDLEPADSKYSRDLAQSFAEDDEDEPLLESQRLHLKAKVPLIDAPPKILAPRRSNRVINSGCKRQLSSEPNSQEALSCELPSPVNSTTSRDRKSVV